MKRRAVTATIFGIAVLALASVACNGDDSTPGPTAPAATPTAPTEAASSVTGTVTYREKIALTPDAVVEVTLVDVSRADAPSVTVGEQVIENPGQVPINFEITYDLADIDDRFTYAVQVRITEGDRLVFITDTRYPVITRGAPTHVDILLVKVAAAPAPAAPTPTPTTPPATATPTPPPASSTPAPATPTPEPPAEVEVDAPVESVKVVVAETDPQHFTLQIVSGLPSGCASFKGYTSSVEGTNVIVTVTNLMPAGPVACTTDYRRHQGEIALGDGFTVGQTYRVIVNGNVTNGFTPTDPAGPELGVTISPIEQVEVTSDGAGYTLTVVSLLPTDSSCSFFDGYEVRTPMLGLIEVTITHQQVVTFAPCTADLPIVVTEIPLGTELAAGRDYTVTVNGQLPTTFTVR